MQNEFPISSGLKNLYVKMEKLARETPLSETNRIYLLAPTSPTAIRKDAAVMSAELHALGWRGDLISAEILWRNLSKSLAEARIYKEVPIVFKRHEEIWEDSAIDPVHTVKKIRELPPLRKAELETLFKPILETNVFNFIFHTELKL